MAWRSVQAQHKGLLPTLNHTHAHTPGMNLGGDKALIESRWLSKGCVCAQLCLEAESRTEASGFLHLVVLEWRQMLQASGSKQLKEVGGEEV